VVNRAIAQLNAMHDGMPLDMRMESLPQAEGDFDQLVLLFVHLLGNAIKFKKGEKATVMVSGTLLKKNSFKALKDEYQYEDFLKIEVTDLGIGFDRKHRENIFELFNKQHYGEGQGIGLALCRKIVDNHRGAIEADSHLHMSTTITIWLPLRQTTKAVSLKPS
jgi:signal transduction histidine kinase